MLKYIFVSILFFGFIHSASASNSFRHNYTPSVDYLMHGYDHHSRQVDGLFFHLGYSYLNNPLIVKDANNTNKLGVLIDDSHSLPIGLHLRKNRLSFGLNTQFLFLSMGDAYPGDSSYNGLGDTKLNITYDLFRHEKATFGVGVNASYDSGDRDFFTSYGDIAYGIELFYTGVLNSRFLYSTALGFNYAKDAFVGTFDLQRVLSAKLAVKYILNDEWSLNFEGVKEWTFPGNNNLNPNEGLLLAQYSSSENLHFWAGAGVSNFFDTDDSRNFSFNLGTKFKFPSKNTKPRLKTVKDIEPLTPEKTAVVATGKPLNPRPSYESKLVVYFGFNSSELSPAAKKEIKRAVTKYKLLKEKKLYIGGFTDSRGNPVYNKLLSKKRAAVVYEYLLGLGYKGTPEILAHGESKLIFESAQNEKQHASNRRVEVFVLSDSK